MKQQDKELALAAGKPCPFCDLPMQAGGDGRFDDRDASREHLRPRALGATLSCYDGHNKLIVCRACNSLKGDDTLVVFLLQLLRAGDAIRAEGVAGVIADIYAALGEDRGADELVGMPETELPRPKRKLRLAPRVAPTEALPPKHQRCMFPSCFCKGACERYGRPSAKEAPG